MPPKRSENATALTGMPMPASKSHAATDLAEIIVLADYQATTPRHRRPWRNNVLSSEEHEMLADARRVPASRRHELRERINEIVEDILDEEEDNRDIRRRRALIQRAREQQDADAGL